MKKSTQLHLLRLVRHHGTYSHVARALDITPRWIRAVRNEENPKAKNRTLNTAGKLLQLQQLLRALRTSGALTDDHISAAWSRLRPSASESPPPTFDLAQASASSPRQ